MKSFRLERGGNNNEVDKNTIGGIVSLIFVVGVVWYFWGGGLEKQTSRYTENINKQVSSDVVQQYEIAKRQGDKVQICVQAGLVSAVFLQGKDEASYQQWKAIEKADCSSAGINQ
ncbi:MAG: hypothetical protein WCO12_02140 [bacterium]